MSGACSMCSGTDCASMCAQGQCYAEHMQWQQAMAEEAMQAEYDAFIEEGCGAAIIIEQLARAFA